MKTLEMSIREYPTYKLEEVLGEKRQDYSSEAIEFAEDELILRKLGSLNPIEQIDFISSLKDLRLKFIINQSRQNYSQTLFNLAENEYAKRGFETAEWYYLDNNKPIGPVKLSDLKKLVRSMNLFPYSHVFREGLQDWVQAGGVPGLFDRSNPNIPPPPPSLPPLPYNNIPPILSGEDKAERQESQNLGFGLGLLCVLFPIIGLILFFTEKNDKGKNALGLAFLGAIIGIILYFSFMPTFVYIY